MIASDEPYMNWLNVGCSCVNCRTSSSGFQAKRKPRMMTEDSVIISIAPMTSLNSEDSRIPRMFSQARKRIRTTVSAAQRGLSLMGPTLIEASRNAGIKKLM